MAGRGRPPEEERRNPSDVPIRGEWKAAPGVGWQHGEVPPPPAGLLKASRQAWQAWMGGWFAAFWTPDDLPALRHLVRLYDQVERGEFHRAGELRLLMDTYGATPKGRQDRRWKPPAEERPPGTPSAPRYGHLRPVEQGETP
ncbi:MAG: hypothetical protein WD250_13170 [Egibacteraceae bacterium]